MTPPRSGMFAILAGCSGLAAAYHVVGAGGGLAEDLTPASRQLLVVVIDCLVAWYLLRRPLWPRPTSPTRTAKR